MAARDDVGWPVPVWGAWHCWALAGSLYLVVAVVAAKSVQLAAEDEITRAYARVKAAAEISGTAPPPRPEAPTVPNVSAVLSGALTGVPPLAIALMLGSWVEAVRRDARGRSAGRVRASVEAEAARRAAADDDSSFPQAEATERERALEEHERRRAERKAAKQRAAAQQGATSRPRRSLGKPIEE